MTEAWISLDSAERRKNWRAGGYLTAVCAGVALAVSLSAGSSPFWWVLSILCAWIISMAYLINRGCGRSLLTLDGIVAFNGFLGKRSIPWSDVTNIEKRHHTTRSSSWWDLRLTRTSGRPLTIPGAFTSSRYDPKFEAKYVLLCQYWRQSVG
jgi:hypothetical protein